MTEHLKFRGIPVTITTQTVGNCFGTIAVAEAAGYGRWESPTCGFGCESAAIELAKDLAAKALSPHTAKGRAEAMARIG